MNARLDEVQTAILRLQLARLEEDIPAPYRDRLAGTSLTLPQETGEGRHVYYIYVFPHPARNELPKKAAGRGHPPQHRLPLARSHDVRFLKLGYRKSDLLMPRRRPKKCSRCRCLPD